MTANLKFLVMAALLATSLLAQNAHAGPVGPLTTFTAGTPAKASEVNGNFSAVSTAVNDNASRIGTLETNPNLGGNLTLVEPSTATAGNIMKGTASFIHDFGTNNTFVGVAAGNFTMLGLGNTAVGFSALTNNQGTGAEPGPGDHNTAIGAGALQSNTTGSANTASGYRALSSNTTGGFNTANGQGALVSNTTGTDNTAIGDQALQNNTTGSNNIALGVQAGNNLTTGGHNIDIGNQGVAAEGNTIRIGDSNQTKTFISGISGVTTSLAGSAVFVDANGQLGTISSSRRVKDHIADMEEASSSLLKLRPVTFYYKSDRNPKGRTLQYGLVAEEVAEVMPGLVAHSADGKIETVYYQFLAPMLLNEYQKQQREIKAQAALLAKQSAEITALKQQAEHVAGLLDRLERADMRTAAAR